MNPRLLYAAPLIALAIAGCQPAKAGATKTTAPPVSPTATGTSAALVPAVVSAVPTIVTPTTSAASPAPSLTTPAPAPTATTALQPAAPTTAATTTAATTTAARVPTPSRASSTALPVPTKTAPAVATLPCTASVSNESPHHNQTIVVLVQTAAGAQVTVTAHYKTKDTVHTATASGAGQAGVPFDISMATYGFTVSVDVHTSVGGQSAACSTSFTPAAA